MQAIESLSNALASHKRRCRSGGSDLRERSAKREPSPAASAHRSLTAPGSAPLLLIVDQRAEAPEAGQCGAGQVWAGAMHCSCGHCFDASVTFRDVKGGQRQNTLIHHGAGAYRDPSGRLSCPSCRGSLAAPVTAGLRRLLERRKSGRLHAADSPAATGGDTVRVLHGLPLAGTRRGSGPGCSWWFPPLLSVCRPRLMSAVLRPVSPFTGRSPPGQASGR